VTGIRGVKRGREVKLGSDASIRTVWGELSKTKKAAEEKRGK